MLRAILLVGLGGGIGSILRYLTSLFVSKYFQSSIPLGTFLVNVIGCLIIGFFLGFIEKQHLTNSMLLLLLVTGFCGGFTTFSAFAAENVLLFQSGNTLTALLYIALSIILCLLAVWGGISLAKLL